MLKYAYYTLLYAINIQVHTPIMQIFCKYIDCISRICTKYARNMHEICINMQFYPKNMQVYANNMQ